MSLLKQLLISVSLAILIILGGTLWLSVESARSYLNTQLQSQTDSAATSLALTLSQPSNQDPVTQELIIMAQFDSGQFSEIRLTDPQGSVLLRRQTQEGQSHAPAWFSRLLPIEATESAAQVSDGWRQVGLLHLRADASYARDSLWYSFTRLVVWVLGAGAVWALFVLFLIRWLRRVLHQEVTEQLRTLTQKEHPNTEPYKKSTFAELDEVTLALATARQSIVVTAEEQHAKIELLQVELNQDEVTGLVNRKYFINELRRQLGDADSPQGWLFLFRQRDLAAINKVMMRTNVDEWLRSLSQQLQSLIAGYSTNAYLCLARLNGSDFVLLAQGLNDEQWHQLMHAVQQILRQQRIQLPHGEYCRWAMAQTDFQSGQYLAHVLARLDQALMRAESAGHNVVESLTSVQTEQLMDYPKGGEGQWRHLIQEGLVQHEFSLELTAKKHQQQPWYEAVLALQAKGVGQQKMLGYQFMPVATRLGLSGVCDVRAFELALTHLQTNPQDRLLLRVSLSSITQKGFVDQVAQLLAASEDVLLDGRLAVELDAYALSSEPIQVAAFNTMLASFQVLSGARRVLQLPRVLLDLNTLHVAYIRVTEADLVEFIHKKGGDTMLSNALVICQTLGVSFVFDGDLQLLPEPIRLMLQEYGK